MTNVRKIKLEEGKIIPLKYDFMFMEIFNNEKNIDIIESFISTYFDVELEEIKGKVKLKSRSINIKNKYEKNNRVDLLLELKGEVINIELNNELPQGKIDRNVGYVSKIYGNNLKYGERTYNKINKTYQINLTSTRCNEDRIIEEYYFRNEKGKILTKNIQIDLVDMEKAKEKCYTHSKREENISKWCKVILTDEKDILKKNVGEMNMSKESKEKLVKRVEELSSDEECIELYTELSDRELTYNTMIEDAEIAGIEKGIEKGKNEATISIAKNLIKLGISLNDIIKSTGLTKEEIEKLRN